MLAGANKKIVFLFARQRSGTGALSSLLNQHPDCNYLGEVFGSAHEAHPHHYFNWLQKAVLADPSLVLPSHALDRLHAYLDYLRGAVDEGVLVLDLKISQAHHFEPFDRGIHAPPRFYDMVRDVGSDVIFLRRENLVRTYLSKLSAIESGIWHAEGSRPPLPLLKVDVESMLPALRQLARREKYMDGLRKFFPGSLELSYEALFGDGTNYLSPEVALSLERVLGLSGLGTLETRQQKLRPGRLEEIVENHAELRQALKGTAFESMTG